MWVKDPDSGRRLRRARPSTDWVVTECPALIDNGTWIAVQQRFTERSPVETLQLTPSSPTFGPTYLRAVRFAAGRDVKAPALYVQHISTTAAARGVSSGRHRPEASKPSQVRNSPAHQVGAPEPGGG